MTTWRYHLCLLVFLCIFSSSEGNCFDYFDVNNWKENLNDEIYLVKTKNPEDMIECTLERECLKDITKESNLCIILHHCFVEKEMVTEITEKCKEDAIEPVPLYHFMCLIAKHFKIFPSICKYDAVCRLYSQGEPAACVKAPTVLSPTTSTEIPTTTPALPKSEAATGTTQSTACACSGEKAHNKDKQAPHQEKEDVDYKLILIGISVFCNLALLCYVCWQRNDGRVYGSPSERESMINLERPEEPGREMTAV